MTSIEIVLWLLLVLVGLILAGLGAGLETGVYCLNRVRLHVRQQSSNSARLLAKHIAAPTALIGSLLIGHNAGVKLATHAAAELLHQRYTDWQVVVFDAIIMMPLLFAFAETVPKDLFAVHADRLLYRFVRPMVLLVYVCRYTGLLPLITGASALMMRLLGIGGKVESFHARQQVQLLVREGVGHGLLSQDQLAIVDRVLALADRRIGEVMTPWEETIKIKISEKPDVLWELASNTTHSWFPVVDGQMQSLRGVVNVFDALVCEKASCPPIESLMTNVQTVSEELPLRDALAHLQREHSPIAVVLDSQKQPMGVVTIKDLIEPITGELANW